MAVNYGTSIARSNLVFYVDAANPKSAPGTSLWYDLSGYNSTLTVSGSPALTTLGTAKCYRFTASGQKFTGSLLGPQPTTSMTIETWIYPETDIGADDRACLLLINGASSGYMSLNKSNRQMSNYWYSHATEGYWETGAAILNNTWNSFTAVWDFSTSSIYQWTNGVKTTGSSTFGNAATGNGINIAQEGSSRQFSGGIAFMKVYNVALSDSDVLQNYRATRGRFGQ